ncbi:MAG TPA: HEPN domain-containing protein [Bacilli bacterium]|nr:HEPN domain-containing protein [Bacilli bacterium]
MEYALRYLDIRNLWTVLSKDMGMRPDYIKKTLSLIIHRRNEIAHEADFNQVKLTKNPIDKMTCDSNIEFISIFCEAINKYINNNGSQHMV